MTTTIHKLKKDDFYSFGEVGLTISNASGMTVSHFAFSKKSTEATIPFVIEGTDGHVTDIDDVEFSISVRKKVNLTATGPNEQEITDVGEDVGEYRYANDVPTDLRELPPGFRELYKGK